MHPRRRDSLTAAHPGDHSGDSRLAAYRRLLARHKRLIRRISIGAGILAGILSFGCLGLWWRLASGPIQVDVFTPWLASAIEENFGSRDHVEVGGTQIERTENGGAAVRVRDIVVRDRDGAIVASAPKAEVHVSGMSLLRGHMRAESLNLVGAEMAVRIEQDGNVTVFAGANKHPIATATVAVAAGAPGVDSGKSPSPQSATLRPTTVPSAAIASTQERPATDVLAALVTWIDGIGETGLDGHELRELGLKDGNLSVDDERTGKHWVFHDISLSIKRSRDSGVVLTVGSDNPERSWALTAAIKPTQNGYHRIELEARKVAASDLLLALRLGDGTLQTDVPLSASIRGEIGPDGTPASLTGRIVADAGFVSGADSVDGRIDIDRAEFKLDWDAANRVLSVPFQIFSGGDRITLLAQVAAPGQAGAPWSFTIGGGTVVLTSPGSQSDALVLNRIAVSGRFDAAKKRFVVDEGDLGNADLGGAISGNADWSNGDLHLTAGFAGTRMSVESLKRLWPAFVSPKVRAWFLKHFTAGTVERLVIAVNAPLDTLKASGPPVPDDGLSIDAAGTHCVVQPLDGLPALRDADLTVHIVGRDAQVALGNATADLPSGRKLALSSGLFEVPDTAPRAPPARVRFKIDGSVAAATELLRMERLRDYAAGILLDPATTHGTMTAQVTLAMPLKDDLPRGSTNYTVALDATNFSAEHMVMGQKVEAATLHVNATQQGFQLRGDVKIAGAPMSLEFRKAKDDTDADVHIQGMLDAAARSSLGFDTSGAISGAIPIRLTGRVAVTSDRDGRFAVEADLTPAQINGLLPGWVKPAGKPAHATFTLTTKPPLTRIDDLVIDGAGGVVKGMLEFDSSGEVQSANFPSYGFSDGDRASLKVDRAQDGALRVSMRGELYDGRSFVKGETGGAFVAPADKRQSRDVDLDLKLGAVVGFNGEALRGVELKMSRRAGEIRSLGLSAKIGRDATLSGELRGQPGGREAVYLQSGDAGALFRFVDMYSRMSGGQMALSMDAPSHAEPMQQGVVNVSNFVVHDETELQRAAQSGDRAPPNGLQFSSMRINFTRVPGKLALHDGVVRGPMLGGTIDGTIDYARDQVHLRGTLVPLYGANNLLGQIPVVGLFLGGAKEGLVGVTYEVVGKPGSPVLNINPISALAPGLLRKIFEFPAATDN